MKGRSERAVVRYEQEKTLGICEGKEEKDLLKTEGEGGETEDR